MDSAPKTGERILVLTADWGIVTAYWSDDHFAFYPELRGEVVIGEWVSDWCTKGSADQRLFCGATPEYWKPIGQLPKRDRVGEPIECWF